MPTYTWHCDQCDTKTDVIRKMSDIDAGPDAGCERCGNKLLNRTIEVDPNSKNVIWKCGGNHDSEYTKTRSRN